MTAYRYQLDVRDNLSQLSSCLANNALLSQFVFSEKVEEGHHQQRLVKREDGTPRQSGALVVPDSDGGS